jgi:hypothetical protein
VELLCGTQEEGKEKGMIVNNIKTHDICAGRGSICIESW